MLKRKYSILASAVALAVPVVGNAATITFTFAPGDIEYAAAATGPYTVATNTGTATNPVITVPNGSFVEYGVQALVTPDANGYGMDAYGVGVANSNGAVATVNPSPTVVDNPPFSSLQAAGTADGLGGVNAALGTTGSYIPGGATGIGSKAFIGVGTPQELFNSQRLKPNAATNTSLTLSLTVNTGGIGFITSAGTTGSGAQKYGNRPFTAGVDVLGTLPVLTINYGTVVTSGPTHQPIISLTSGSTPVASYGPADGTLTLTGKGNSSYNVATATGFSTATTGSVMVSGFNPSTDTEIYALKLSSNGTPLTSGQISTVIGDINGTNGTNASTGVVASTITGVYTTLFPGYSVLLTATGVTQPAELGFDFSSAAEQDTTVPGITVTGVAAVPEPATAAGLVLGAAGLLLGRRKNRLAVA